MAVVAVVVVCGTPLDLFESESLFAGADVGCFELDDDVDVVVAAGRVELGFAAVLEIDDVAGGGGKRLLVELVLAPLFEVGACVVVLVVVDEDVIERVAERGLRLWLLEPN